MCSITSNFDVGMYSMDRLVENLRKLQIHIDPIVYDRISILKTNTSTLFTFQ